LNAIADVLAAAADSGVKLWVESGELRFRAPKGAVTPELRGMLQARKPELIAWLGSQPAVAIPRIPEAQDYPLSSGQRRLWVLAQMDEGSAVYHIPLALRLDGPFDRRKFSMAFAAVVRRHESLRTRFVAVNGEPRQRIDPDGGVAVEWHDVSAAPDVEAAAHAWVAAAVARPFDLATGPLVRVALLQLAPERHVLVATLHHIVADGVSLAVFVRELAESYAAGLRGENPEWIELPVQYRDYAAWQLAQADSAAMAGHRRYWLEKLAGAPSALELPTDRPRPAMQTFRGRIHAFRLEPALLHGLRGLARSEKATLFMVLVALVKVLLRRQTGREDIIVASPIAGREHADLEGQIGFFLNTLVLRDLVEGDAAFSALVQRVRRTALEAYEHQAYPFDQLVDALALPRDLSRAPLCDVVVMLQNTGDLRLALAGVDVRPFTADPGISKFDLTFDFQEGADGLEVGLEYNTDLFDDDRIERLAGALGETARRAVADPAQTVAALGVLPAEEEERVVRTFNATLRPLPREATVVTLIQAQVARTPNAIAVGCAGRLLSYADLNARSNRLAQHLRKLGAGPDVAVGVCLQRSVELPVALLAVLKAGAHYVPLDPYFPHERLAFMAADAGASILVAETATSASWEAAPGRHTVQIDADAATIVAYPEHDSFCPAGPEHAAYVIYTSGSTGRPKGVEVVHRGLTNFLLSMADSPGLGAGDVLLAVTTISFDIAGLELWLPLTVGARIELAERAVAADGPALSGLLQTSGATVMQATPATWRLLLAADWKGALGLRAYCGGEALSGDLAAQLLLRCAALWNLYGPTETTIWSTLHQVTQADVKDATVTIGRPMANTQCYVLDDSGVPVPIGVPGNLWIGGSGVARGYWRSQELTAEKFVPDPFVASADAAGARQPDDEANAQWSRIYKTGDIARWRTNGTLDYLGRGDQQVKLRGYRIEPGEIEHALVTHPAVMAAAVRLREDTPGDPRLVAYVVPRAAPIEAALLREHLRTRLPDYMVPSVWVSLAALPLTANGKVDRKALPAPGAADRSAGDAPSVGPRTFEEVTVAEIWAEVLGLTHVGIHDNFFELGGHSLKATMAVARLRERYPVAFTIADLFRRPTVAAFAELLVEAPAGANLTDSPAAVAPITAEELELLNG
jgi:amino acid adenylation domain-containing protein